MRMATKHDKTEVIEMMLQFLGEADLPEFNGINNLRHWNALLDRIFAGAGAIFFEPGKGLLMAMVTPTIWDDSIMSLNELAWYVKPEYRAGTIGHRLFKAYVEYGNSLKAQGRVRYFTMSKMDTSPNLKYEKHGFRKKDENWIQ
jgi:GNAT superfamily N-acetyltransferase